MRFATALLATAACATAISVDQKDDSEFSFGGFDPNKLMNQASSALGIDKADKKECKLESEALGMAQDEMRDMFDELDDVMAMQDDEVWNELFQMDDDELAMFFAEEDFSFGGLGSMFSGMKDKAKAMLAKGEAYAKCLKDKATGMGKSLLGKMNIG